jgi:DNA-binding MarR family transcriptional regulator
MVMWSNCMRWVDEGGVRVDELTRLARTEANLNGMTRWGYIRIEPDRDSRSKRPGRDWIIRATPKGPAAQQIWRPLFAVIEKRWEERFGKEEIDELRDALRALNPATDPALPDCLPILGYGLFSRVVSRKRAPEAGAQENLSAELALSALLSRALLAFAIEFERDSDLSLAISADIVRVLEEKGIRVRDLPLLTGVSKEAISMALGVLQKKRLVAAETNSDRERGKIVRLTAQGRKAQDAYRQLLRAVEERWNARYGEGRIRALRSVLDRLAGDATSQHSPLFRGLEPYADGWRASMRKPKVLPHYPMVLHRGGFPDGS